VYCIHTEFLEGSDFADTV